MLTYVSRFLSGDFEPFWLHAILLSLAVLASIAVGGGIIFERPKYPPSVHRVAFWLVVVGIAIEAVCTILLFVFDEGISNAQQSKIISLETRLLEVGQRTADRDLTAEEQEKLSRVLAPFSGQPAKIVVFPVNFESVSIAGDIYGVLLNAHWSVSFPEYLDKPPNNFLVKGGWIESSNDDASQNAADALFDALKPTAIGMGEAKGKFPHVQFDPTKPLVWILIGDKPTPLRSWVTP